MLCHLALRKLVIEELQLEETEHLVAFDILKDCNSTNNVQFHVLIHNEIFLSANKKFEDKLTELESRGATVVLWVQYFEVVSLVKSYIMAERSGKWNMHCITRIFSFLHADDYFAYANSAQLYLQDALNLHNIMPAEEFAKFMKQSYFTLGRSSEFWCGIFSDQIIEQIYMRSMKTQNRSTHGCGMSSSVQKWTECMPEINKIYEQVEQYCRT